MIRLPEPTAITAKGATRYLHTPTGITRTRSRPGNGLDNTRRADSLLTI